MKMKYSGNDWIKDVPEDWHLIRLKFIFDSIQGGNWGNEDGVLDDDVICLRVADFDYANGVIKHDGKFTHRNYSGIDVSKYILDHGDILIEKSGGGEKTPVGRTVIFDKDYKAVYSNFLAKAKVKKQYNPKFVQYYLMALYSHGVTRLYFNQTTGIQNLDINKLINTEKIPVCSSEDQNKIVTYLDKKLQQINKLSKTILKEIKNLKDYRNSLIAETVTKGLDPNVSSKDSGIEWVGSIPESWRVVPLYKLFNERKNKNIAGREQNLLSLSYGKIKRRDINAKGGLLPANFNTYNIVEDGDIIIRPTDLQNDQHSLRTGIVREHGIITSAYIDLAPLPNTNSAYYHYLLHSYDIEKVFYNMGNGVRQGLNYNGFSKLKVLVPSDREMSNIVDYFNRKNIILDNLVEKKQQQLNLLKEYKNSLIYEYVTGKKKVPMV